MMADLVNEHMPNDRSQALAMLRPVIEDRTAEEKNHDGQPAAHLDPSREGKADAQKEAEKVEFRFRAHVFQHLLGGEVLDADNELAAEGSKAPR